MSVDVVISSALILAVVGAVAFDRALRVRVKGALAADRVENGFYEALNALLEDEALPSSIAAFGLDLAYQINRPALAQELVRRGGFHQASGPSDDWAADVSSLSADQCKLMARIIAGALIGSAARDRLAPKRLVRRVYLAIENSEPTKPEATRRAQDFTFDFVRTHASKHGAFATA